MTEKTFKCQTCRETFAIGHNNCGECPFCATLFGHDRLLIRALHGITDKLDMIAVTLDAISIERRSP